MHFKRDLGRYEKRKCLEGYCQIQTNGTTCKCHRCQHRRTSLFPYYIATWLQKQNWRHLIMRNEVIQFRKTAMMGQRSDMMHLERATMSKAIKAAIEIVLQGAMLLLQTKSSHSRRCLQPQSNWQIHPTSLPNAHLKRRVHESGVHHLRKVYELTGKIFVLEFAWILGRSREQNCQTSTMPVTQGLKSALRLVLCQHTASVHVLWENSKDIQ